MRGLSPDCANGCHEPLCDGRNCSCDCHRSRRMSAAEPRVHLERDGRARCGKQNVLLTAGQGEATCKACLNLLAGTHHVEVHWADPKPCGTEAAYRRHLRREGAPVRCEPCLKALRRKNDDQWSDDDWREAYNARRREQYAAARAAGMTVEQATRAKDQRRAA